MTKLNYRGTKSNKTSVLTQFDIKLKSSFQLKNKNKSNNF